MGMDYQAVYGDLRNRIGKLTRAAIDAYVRDEEDGFGVVFERNEKEYSISSGSAGASMEKKISRPNARGEGGGSVTCTMTNVAGSREMQGKSYWNKFEDIRDRINRILDPWVDLPDPRDIDDEIGKCRKVVECLSKDSSIQGNVIVPNGQIHDNLDSIKGELQELRGSTVKAFRANFVGRLDGAVNGQAEIAKFWGAALGSEMGIFKKAREAVAQAVIRATEMFEEIANSSSSSEEFKVVMKIADFALGGFSIFLTGGKTGKEVAKKAVDSLKTVTGLSDKNFSAPPSQSFGDGMTVLKKVFKAIDENITNSEKAVERNLIDNFTAIHSSRQRYDFSMDTIESSETKSSEALLIQQDRVDAIVKNFSPPIVTELATAQKKIEDVSMADCVNRDKNIGLGIYGPSSRFHDMKWLLHDLVKKTKRKVEYGIKDFERAVAFIQEQDADSKAKLDEMNKKIEDSDGEDPDPWQDRR